VGEQKKELNVPDPDLRVELVMVNND